MGDPPLSHPAYGGSQPFTPSSQGIDREPRKLNYGKIVAADLSKNYPHCILRDHFYLVRDQQPIIRTEVSSAVFQATAIFRLRKNDHLYKRLSCVGA